MHNTKRRAPVTVAEAGTPTTPPPPQKPDYTFKILGVIAAVWVFVMFMLIETHSPIFLRMLPVIIGAGLCYGVYASWKVIRNFTNVNKQQTRSKYKYAEKQ